MKNGYIEGINGNIQVTDKYIFISIDEKSGKRKKYLVYYNEVESVNYKMPTRDMYGYLEINLYTKSVITNSNKSYKIILESIKEKDLNTNSKIVDYLRKTIHENKKSEKELVENDDITKKAEKEQEAENDKEIKEEKEDIKNSSQSQTEKYQKSSEETKESVRDKTAEKITSNKDNNFLNQNETSFEVVSKNNTIEEKSVNKDESYEQQTPLYSIGSRPQNKSKSENITQINDKQKLDEETITILFKRLKALKKDLDILEFKLYIINNYKNDKKDKEEVEKLIEEINYLEKQLEKITKELTYQNNVTKKCNNLNLENGKVIITSISERLNFLSKDRLEEYIKLYNSTKNKLFMLEEKKSKLREKVEKEKTEIDLSEEEYEKEINKLYDVKSNREFITKYRYEIERKVKEIHKEIETTIDPQVRYRIVHKGISERTQNLSLIASLNSLRPARNRLISAGLIFTTGINAIRDIFSYEVKEEYYDNIITKEKYVGFENIDTTDAFNLIKKSKESLESIIKKCDNDYKDYPDFAKLKSELIGVKNEIEEEERSLKQLNDTIEEYKNQKENIKVLKLERDNQN